MIPNCSAASGSTWTHHLMLAHCPQNDCSSFVPLQCCHCCNCIAGSFTVCENLLLYVFVKTTSFRSELKPSMSKSQNFSPSIIIQRLTEDASEEMMHTIGEGVGSIFTTWGLLLTQAEISAPGIFAPLREVLGLSSTLPQPLGYHSRSNKART